MSLDILKRQFSNVHTVFFDLYDQQEAEHRAALETFAWIHDNRQARENPVELDYLLSFPEATSWLDEMEIFHTLDQLMWTVPMEGHHAVVPFNRVNLNRPNTVAKLAQVTAQLPAALNRREIELCMQVFRTNPLSVTGQNFFSDAHPKPHGGTYSNILRPEFGTDLKNPSLQVLFELIEEVLTRFSSISLLQSQLVDDDKLRGSLQVIVHNERHQTLFRRLARNTALPVEVQLTTGVQTNLQQNALQGTFGLWRDAKPAAGQEDWIEFILKTGPGGPKAMIYVLDEDPMPVTLDENRVSNGFYGVGFEKIFAVKPFVPNVVIQARPVLAAGPGDGDPPA